MAVNYQSTQTYNTNKDSPYSTYTKISDIAGSLGQQFTSGRGTQGEKIAGAITSALTGLAMIKDLKGGADKLAKTASKGAKGAESTIAKAKNEITGTPKKMLGGGRSKSMKIGDNKSTLGLNDLSNTWRRIADIGQPISTGYSNIG